MFTALRLRPIVAVAAAGTACIASAAVAHSQGGKQQTQISQRDRAKAAIVGAFVADAATMGLHWIYDQTKVDALVAFRRDVPAFFEPPSSPAYKYQSGSLSIYGHGLMPVLRSVVEHHGLNSELLEETHFDAALFDEARTRKALKESVHARDLAEIPIIVARYAGGPNVLERVDELLTRKRYNRQTLVVGRMYARILEKVVLGQPLPEVLEWMQTTNDVPEEEKEMVKVVCAIADSRTLNTIAVSLGMDSKLPGLMQVALLAIKRYPRYDDAVNANIMAAGDNCARAILVGAVKGAENGSAGIPAAWKQKTKMSREIEALAEQIVADNPHLK